MAGYPKLWTTLRHEDWFKRLSISQRGIWYEMILIAKEQKDDGHVTFRSYRHAGDEIGCDRVVFSTWLKRECAEGRCNLVEKSTKLLHIFIVHYNDAQALSRYVPRKKSSVSIKRKQEPSKRRYTPEEKPKIGEFIPSLRPIIKSAEEIINEDEGSK